MEKKQFLSPFWQKRWDKYSGYLFCDNLTRTDIINAKIRYECDIDRDTAIFINNIFPRTVKDDAFWAAVVSSPDQIRSGKWKDMLGDGQKLKEHSLLDLAVTGNDKEKVMAHRELIERGFTSSKKDVRLPVLDRIEKKYEFEMKEYVDEEILENRERVKWPN